MPLHTVLMDLFADRFQMLRPIGRGGMAEVWAARQIRTGDEVAVKLVRGTAEDSAVRRLRREASVIAAISHPGVVDVHGIEHDDGKTAVVMDLLRGQDLARMLADGPLPLPRTLTLARGIADALRAVHRAGVVHRDVKPANVMVTGEQVTLIDFGIATEPGHSGGAPSYGTTASMAPEQIRAEQVTPATDMYALGCLIFETLTGGPMFPVDSPEIALRHHAHGTPPRLGELVIGAPARLDGLVADLLAKDPADRPSAAEVSRALDSLLRAPAVRLQSGPLAPAPEAPSPQLDAAGTQPMLAAEAVWLEDAA